MRHSCVYNRFATWLVAGALLGFSSAAFAQEEPAEEPAAEEPAAEEPAVEEPAAEEPAAEEPAAEEPKEEPKPEPKEEPKAEPEPAAEPAPAEGESECPDTFSTADVRSALETAQSKFASLDVDGFKAATDEAHDDLPCLSDKFTRNLAAEYHRFQGLRAFIEKDPVNSTLSFAAARSIEPAYRFPESFVPKGNPVLGEYEAIDIEAGEFDTVGAPKLGRIEFDGREALDRPTSWPTLVQLFNDDGSVAYTGYLAPGDPLPEYEAKPIPAGDGEGGGPNVGLLGGGAGGVVLSGLFYVVGASAKGKYTDSATPYEDLDGLRGTVNGMQTASIAAGIVGVGLVGGSFVLGAN